MHKPWYKSGKVVLDVHCDELDASTFCEHCL
jgi:hypothetical protein